ncbi:MAG: hypothetical protein M3416_00180 [Acidobacteriota bacterium]|nr:hypothetical protein [Acidobacteriota bacterium]
MNERENTSEESIDVASLYPELTEEQQREAAYYLGRYLDVVQRIFERVNGLTGPGEDGTL